MRKANFFCALVGMAVSGTAFFMTLGFKKFKNVPVEPAFFPRILTIGLFISSLILLIQAITADPKKDKKSPTISPMDKGMRRLFAGIAIIVVYALLWEPLGFIISTPLAMAGMMFLLGYRNYLKMVTFSLGTMIVVFGAFKFFLTVDMPLGVLESLF